MVGQILSYLEILSRNENNGLGFENLLKWVRLSKDQPYRQRLKAGFS